jgi:hypothetical protein
MTSLWMRTKQASHENTHTAAKSRATVIVDSPTPPPYDRNAGTAATAFRSPGTAWTTTLSRDFWMREKPRQPPIAECGWLVFRRVSLRRYTER